MSKGMRFVFSNANANKVVATLDGVDVGAILDLAVEYQERRWVSEGVEVTLVSRGGEISSKGVGDYAELHVYPNGRITIACEAFQYTLALEYANYYDLSAALNREFKPIDHREW